MARPLSFFSLARTAVTVDTCVIALHSAAPISLWFYGPARRRLSKPLVPRGDNAPALTAGATCFLKFDFVCKVFHQRELTVRGTFGAVRQTGCSSRSWSEFYGSSHRSFFPVLPCDDGVRWTLRQATGHIAVIPTSVAPISNLCGSCDNSRYLHAKQCSGGPAEAFSLFRCCPPPATKVLS